LCHYVFYDISKNEKKTEKFEFDNSIGKKESRCFIDIEIILGIEYFSSVVNNILLSGDISTDLLVILFEYVETGYF